MSLHNMAGWEPITCAQREELVDFYGRSHNGFSEDSNIGPISARTDLGGAYGPPSVFTEWGYRDTGLPVLRDYRWPDSDRECEHYRWVGES